MGSRLSPWSVVVVGACVLSVAAVSLGAPGFAAPSPTTGSRLMLAGSMPDWTKTARVVGAPAPSATFAVRVVLPLRDGAGAEALARRVSDPKSSEYGHYRSATEFNARFAPTLAQVSAVETFLRASGLRISDVAEGNRWVSATGTAAQLAATFAVTLRNYSYHGATQVAPSTPAFVPQSIAPLIAGVIGLDSVSLLHTTDHVLAEKFGPLPATPTAPPATTPPPVSTRSAGTPSGAGSAPCSHYWGEFHQHVPRVYGKTSLPTRICGYGPQQIRTAYGVEPAVRRGDIGAGVTVAVIDAYASPTMRADADAWSARMGIPAFKPGQYSEVGTAASFDLQSACGGSAGWNIEEALDVESVHGIAPGAKIRYVGAKDCQQGIDTAINYVIQHHAADIVSNSYGDLGESDLGDEVALEHSMFLQAAVEGIGFYFSTGDAGDNTGSLPRPAANYPSSDPWVTAVGGTSLGVTRDSSRLFETSWGTMVDPVDRPPYGVAHLETPLPGLFRGGGGGGVSTLFRQPSYQHGSVPDRLSRGRRSMRMRVTPDVAAVADPYTGYFVALTRGGKLVGGAIGGTSLACPVFAGLQALASQGRRVEIGFANPVLYGRSRRESMPFIDITRPRHPLAATDDSGSVVIGFGHDTSLRAVRGFDDATGLGAPDGTLTH